MRKLTSEKKFSSIAMTQMFHELCRDLRKFKTKRGHSIDNLDISLMLLKQVVDKSMNDKVLRSKFCTWMLQGKTLLLLDILTSTSYNNRNLGDFNAFSFMDAANAARKSTVPINVPMDALLLERKEDSTSPEPSLVIFDEIIAGQFTSELFVPVFTGASNGVRLLLLSNLIENYYFPAKNGRFKSNILSYLKGKDLLLYHYVGSYESDELDIDPIG